MTAFVQRWLPALVLASCFLSGCASLRSVSLTRVPVDRSKPIDAESWSWGILGIYFTNSFVDEAIEDLRQSCPNGRITGVYTKYTSRFYLLWTTRTVSLKAYCEAASAGGAPVASRRAKP